jgi:hypothetical protein
MSVCQRRRRCGNPRFPHPPWKIVNLPLHRPLHDRSGNLAYYGITICPTEGEVLNNLPPVPTDSDESSEDDFADEVNRTFLMRAAELENTTSGDAQVSVGTEPAEAPVAPEERPASPTVTPTDTPMGE